MIFTSLSYKILDLDFISGLAWLKWKPLYIVLVATNSVAWICWGIPKLFPQAISTASSRRASGLAPSQRSFPKLFPRLHPVQHPVSLPPSEVSPSDFHGFIPSSIRSRSLPAKFPQAISPSYLHGFIPSSIRTRSLPAKFPQAISTASSRRASGLAPSQRSFPKLLFPRLPPVQHPVSLPPSEVSPSDFHGFIPSSIRSRSLPAKFPQAISPSYFHGFIPSSIRSRSLPAKFPQAISTASSRRASGFAPSQRSFPKLLGCTWPLVNV